jgi:hypothetical protein
VKVEHRTDASPYLGGHPGTGGRTCFIPPQRLPVPRCRDNRSRGVTREVGSLSAVGVFELGKLPAVRKQHGELRSHPYVAFVAHHVSCARPPVDRPTRHGSLARPAHLLELRGDASHRERHRW